MAESKFEPEGVPMGIHDGKTGEIVVSLGGDRTDAVHVDPV
jgi:hypothetical protein